MQHYNDISSQRKGLTVASFLICTVTLVGQVDDSRNTELLSDLDGLVTTRVVYENDVIDKPHRDFTVGHLDGFLSVISWHDNDDFFIKDHDVKVIRISIFIVNDKLVDTKKRRKNKKLFFSFAFACHID